MRKTVLLALVLVFLSSIGCSRIDTPMDTKLKQIQHNENLDHNFKGGKLSYLDKYYKDFYKLLKKLTKDKRKDEANVDISLMAELPDPEPDPYLEPIEVMTDEEMLQYMSEHKPAAQQYALDEWDISMATGYDDSQIVYVGTILGELEEAVNLGYEFTVDETNKILSFYTPVGTPDDDPFKQVLLACLDEALYETTWGLIDAGVVAGVGAVFSRGAIKAAVVAAIGSVSFGGLVGVSVAIVTLKVTKCVWDHYRSTTTI